jgi:hypothetical protein
VERKERERKGKGGGKKPFSHLDDFINFLSSFQTDEGPKEAKQQKLDRKTRR